MLMLTSSRQAIMLTTTDTTSLLLCTLAGEQYALQMDCVREVIRWRVPTCIPGTPPTLLGVIHHRGSVLPIVDVRLLLGRPTPAPSRATRLVIVEHADVSAALISDSVADIVTLEQIVAEPVTALPAKQAQFLHGIVFYADQPLLWLDLAAVFAAITAGRHGE